MPHSPQAIFWFNVTENCDGVRNSPGSRLWGHGFTSREKKLLIIKTDFTTFSVTPSKETFETERQIRNWFHFHAL